MNEEEGTIETTRRDDERSITAFLRGERFVLMDDGYYVKTREGIQGPFADLAAALTGLMSKMKDTKIPRYQMRLLYQSVCEKALESC